MKIIKLILFILFIFSISRIFAEVKISDYHFNSNWGLQCLDTKDNNVVLLAVKNCYPGGNNIPLIYEFNGNNWMELPTFVVNASIQTPVVTHWKSKIHYDSKRNIWLSGFSLYKYSDNKWKEYFLDDTLNIYRRYGQFTIDINDNIWISTQVYNYSQNPRVSYSELLKFDGNKFDVILRSNDLFTFGAMANSVFGNSIVSLSDGNIFIQRVDHLNDSDLYIFDTNNYLTKKELQPPIINGISSKLISNIYAESNHKVWFCYDYVSYQDSLGRYVRCCSGLSLLDGDNWIIFSEENNLPKISPYLNLPVFGIVKMNNNDYLVIASETLFSMGSDYKLNKIDWKTIFDHEEFIPGYSMSKDDAYNYLRKFYEPLCDSALVPKTHDIVKSDDGTIWILMDYGLEKINPLTLSINEKYSIEQEYTITPNPAYDFINISSKNYISIPGKTEIYSIEGRLMLENFNTNRIDISGLSTGLYYIKIYNKVYKFIKLE